jgi:Reverse transcriptase (RNA-dependent DNA polymerase)
LEKFQTWELVNIPKNSNIIGYRWVFRLKHNATRNIVKYRACVVAKGFTQQPRVDFRETFAPITKLASIQSMIALAITHDWELYQIDIKSAYLNGDLKEMIFMNLPPGYTPPGSTGKVCKLKKSIYGLKQAGCQWYQKLSNCFDRIGLTKSSVDHTVFYSHCYGLSTRALKSRIQREVSPKGNSRDDQQETLLVALIDDNVKLARRP